MSARGTLAMDAGFSIVTCALLRFETEPQSLDFDEVLLHGAGEGLATERDSGIAIALTRWRRRRCDRGET